MSFIYLVRIWFYYDHKIKSSQNNFNNFNSLGVYFFIHILVYRLALKKTSQAISLFSILFHKLYQNFIRKKEEKSAFFLYFLIFRFEKVKFIISIFIYISFAKKRLGLIIWSWLILFLLVTSPNTSSNLYWVFFINSSLSSM